VIDKTWPLTDSESYSRHYRTLGIKSPCDWDKLKKIYRKLANIWHPDRHNNDDQSRLLAEEKIKEINQAYKALSDYYRSNRRLPPFITGTPVSQDRSSTSTAKPADADTTAQKEPDYADKTDAIFDETRRPSRFRHVVIFSVLAFSFYSTWKALAPSAPETNFAYNNSDASHQTARPQILGKAPVNNLPKMSKPVIRRYFTYDSKVGEVLAAQGTPTKIIRDIWYYGKSEVHFRNGKVIYWIPNLDNLLNTSSSQATPRRDNKFFTLGSTKNKVRKIQGKPDYVTENSWEYGMSKVYFSGDRVADWYNSPLDPLKARK